MSQIQERQSVPATWIFFLVVGIILFGCAYIIATTFFYIPKENIRFADTYQGFILGTMLSTAIAYYLVSSPSRRQPSSQVAGDNISTTTIITSDEHNNKEKE